MATARRRRIAAGAGSGRGRDRPPRGPSGSSQQPPPRVGRQLRPPASAKIAVRPVAEIEARLGMGAASPTRISREYSPTPESRLVRCLYVASSAMVNPIRILSSFDTEWCGRCPEAARPCRARRRWPPERARWSALSLSGREITGDFGGEPRSAAGAATVAARRPRRKLLAARRPPAGIAAPRAGRPSAGRPPSACAAMRSMAVLQLAHVARPIVGHQTGQSLRAGVEPGQARGACRSRKCSTSSGMSCLALAQGRQPDGEHIEAVVQVLAKAAWATSAFRSRWVAAMMRRSTLRHCSAPTARNSRSWISAQQLDLHLQRQVADFVEESRAAVGQLHQPLLVLRGAAEGALHVAEKLAFHQRAHQRAAIDGHELAARVGVVDGARHHLLAGAAFAQQQHRQPVARRLLDQPARSSIAGDWPTRPGLRPARPGS